MSNRAKLTPEQQLTVDEFLAFTDSRPDGEIWELIEGVAVLNPSPVEFHQVVSANIVTFLMNHKRSIHVAWVPMLGVGTRVPASPRSLPRPDVFVKSTVATNRPDTDDALVIFEVLSPSNRRADQAWRRKVYASVPNCQHYVTVSLKSVDVVTFNRADGWAEHRYEALSDVLQLPAIGVAMPMADIYRWTPLGV